MNKKKIIGLLAAGLIAAVATTNLNIATQESGLSEVSLANVEALADSEKPPVYNCPGGWTVCVQINNSTWYFKK